MEKEEEEIFTVGSRVEVSSNDEGFTGARYIATILSTPSSRSPPSRRRSFLTGNRQTIRNLYFVEYEDLLSDDDPLKPLTEWVDVSLMRPEQPVSGSTDDDGLFEENDIVDVNHRDGWWTGVIRRVVDDGSKFLVFFENPPDEIECERSELRVHLDWVGRKWVKPDKQELVVTSSGRKDNAGASNGCGDSSSNMMDIQIAGSDAKMNNNGSREQGVGKKDSGSTKSQRKKISVKKRSPAQRSNASTEGDKGNQSRLNSNEVIEIEGGEVVEKEGIEDVRFAKKTSSVAQDCRQLLERVLLEHVPAQDLQGSGLNKIITESEGSKDKERHKRKRKGSPRRLLQRLLEESTEGEKHDIDAGALNQIVVKNIATNTVPISTRLQKSIFWSDSYKDFQSLILNKEFFKLVDENKSSPSGARHSKSRKKLGESIYEQLNLMSEQYQAEKSTMLLLEGCPDKTTSVDNGSPNQVLNERALKTPNESSDTQKDTSMTTPSPEVIVNESSDRQKDTSMTTLSPEVIVNESSDRQRDTSMTTPSPEAIDNLENAEESQNLPFAKCSPVWKHIESMDVFKRTPQRPHFSPLVKCKEDSREGLAVGHMITFANLVEKTLNLKVSQPHSIIERSLETLKELESHGFEVKAVESRLTHLQSLKNKFGQLEVSSKQAEEEIMKLNEEKEQLEQLMDTVEIKMRQIKEKLGEAALRKENRVKEINNLKSKVNMFADSLEDTKRDFERVAALPF